METRLHNRKARPQGTVLNHPAKNSVKLGDRYINISAIARQQGITYAFLSKFLAGKKTASIAYTRKVANAIGMTIDELLDCIDIRKKELADQDRAIIKQYEDRIARENAEDLANYQRYGIVEPRIPATRIPIDPADKPV